MPFNYSDIGASVPRIGGSGFTVLQWMGQPIAFAQTLSHQSPQPVAAPKAIQPLDARRPLNIITPAAIGVGTLQIAIYELYNEKVWDRIMRITDIKAAANGGTNSTINQQAIYNDLSEVFVRLAAINPTSGGIVISRVIYPPTLYGQTTRKYADNYHGCKITDIRDDETVEVDTMDFAKTVTIQYTHSTRESDGGGSSNLYPVNL